MSQHWRPRRLEVESLTRWYGRKAALGGVSFVAEPGSFTVLLGPSGSGKSTLLRCIAGIERPTAGTVSLDGRVVAGSGHHVPPERRGLAMVFQDYALWPHMTALDNVTFALRRRNLASREARRVAGEMLERVGLREFAGSYPADLSGGEQQRVALARALVAEPGLLLFDEPLSNLDADLRERLRMEIASLTRQVGATAVYITHDQSEAFAMADQVGILSDGLLIQAATPEEIYVAPATPFVARFTGVAGELTGRIEEIETAGGLGVRVGAMLVPGRTPVGLPLAHGTAARLMIRASAVRLGPGSGDGACARGVVRDVAFRGRGYDHVVEVMGSHLLTGVFDTTRHARDETVTVHLDPAGCLVFPDTAEAVDEARAEVLGQG